MTLQFGASLTDNARSINYDRNTFIIQATDWAKFCHLGYFLKAQAIFGGEIWFVVGVLRAQNRSDVYPLDFQIELDEDILALFCSATVLAYISKNWAIFFVQSSGHPGVSQRRGINCKTFYSRN